MPDKLIWAKELHDKLKESGTGQRALDIVSGRIVKRFERYPALSADHPDRHLTAREAFGVLTEEMPFDTVTHEKAKQLIETGEYKVDTGVKPVDKVPPPPKVVPDAKRQPEPANETPEPAFLAGVQDPLGPKPVEKKPAAKTKLGA